MIVGSFISTLHDSAQLNYLVTQKSNTKVDFPCKDGTQNE